MSTRALESGDASPPALAFRRSPSAPDSGSMTTLETLDHVHFIGIAGAGMRGLARVFEARGPRVTGCDPSATEAPLEGFDEAAVVSEHAPGHLTGDFGREVDLVVYTAALPDDHGELNAARQRGIPTRTYSEALGLVFNDATGIAVAGTHGKTTCASMLAILLEETGCDPTAVIGGRVRRWGGHARAGDGEWFVAEACEFGGNFHAMEPDHVLLTNVDRAHLDFYPDHDAIKASFRDFLAGRTGTVVCHDDDPGGREVVAASEPPICRVGTRSEVDWRVRRLDDTGRIFRLERPDGSETSLPLPVPVPGEHQLDNAAEVAALARELGLEWHEIAAGLEAYDGVGRRFEIVRDDGPLVIDDYAHHPEEIETTIEAARSAYPDRRLVVCFQPHQYKRTYHFMGEWAPAFESVSELWLVDIYGARDHGDVPRVSIEDVAREVRDGLDRLRVFAGPEALGREIERDMEPGDLFLILGAGDIERAADIVATTRSASGSSE